MLLAMFSKNAATSLEEMQKMIDENNMQGVADAAHAIKGSAGNLKLNDIYTLAMTIEMAAKNDKDANLHTHYTQLSILLDTL
jgi:HPt (histidine-containing phosphotransfer) domain-containing protein